MLDPWLQAIVWIILLLIIIFSAIRQNREADRQGGRNHASARIHFGIGHSAKKNQEELYTGDHKINRRWEP